MRPIDGDALKDRLQSLAYDDWNQGVCTSWADAYCECADMVDEQPTITPDAQPKDYTEMKQEFIRMASYIDVLLECSDYQKETLMGFISRLAEFMPWTERD